MCIKYYNSLKVHLKTINEIDITKYYSNKIIIVKVHCRLDDIGRYKFLKVRW